jgi:hypothetical protein
MALPPSRSDGTPFPCQLSEEEYKAKLTGSQYRCLRQGGTEAYRRGEFCNFFPEDGYMACDRPRPKKPRRVHFRRALSHKRRSPTEIRNRLPNSPTERR